MSDDAALNAARADGRAAVALPGTEPDSSESDGTATYAEFVASLSSTTQRLLAEIAARSADQAAGDSPLPGDQPGEANTGPADIPGSAGPVLAALADIRALLSLAPLASDGHTSLSERVTAVRRAGERGLSPGPPGVTAGSGGATPVGARISELNASVAAARHAILALLDRVDMDAITRKRLRADLNRPGEFFKTADRGAGRRGTHNDTRLEDLAAFLHALRQNPHVVVTHALAALRPVAIPPSLLSADPQRGVVTFRTREYGASHETCHFVRLLIEAGGGYVSMPNVGASAGSTTKPVASRLRARLPKELVALIETGKKGSRLLTDRLSHV